MTRLAVIAEAAAAGLAGIEGVFPWGEAVSLDPSSQEELRAHAPDLVLVVGSVPAAGQSAVPSPWPVRDELFALGSPVTGEVLVVGDHASHRQALLEKLDSRGASARGIERLTADELSGASVVVFCREDAETIPATAMAVLAARRLLITPRCPLNRGLFPGIDHLAYTHDDEAVQYADEVLSFPESFESLRAFGALAAQRHRASTVYGRLVVTAALGAASTARPTAPPPSAPPRG